MTKSVATSAITVGYRTHAIRGDRWRITPRKRCQRQWRGGARRACLRPMCPFCLPTAQRLRHAVSLPVNGKDGTGKKVAVTSAPKLFSCELSVNFRGDAAAALICFNCELSVNFRGDAAAALICFSCEPSVNFRGAACSCGIRQACIVYRLRGQKQQKGK